MSQKDIVVSKLGKTWIFDLDGTLVKHNGYLLDGRDSLLEGVKDFFENISPEDKVIIITSRKKEYQKETEEFLNQRNIPYDYILYDMPYGERILVNDKKESGLLTAIAVNTMRNKFMAEHFVVDEQL